MTEPIAVPTEPHARGVLLSKVDPRVLNAALRDAGIKLTRSVSLEDRVILLADHELKESAGDADLPEAERKAGECSECQGVSLLSRHCCPYCGTSDEQPEAKAPLPQKSQKKPASGKALAVVKADAGKLASASVAQLDERVAELRALAIAQVANHWRLGAAIQALHDDGLFKFRVDPEGKQLYPTFEAFCEHEVGLGAQYVRDMMAMAANLTEAQASALGTTKAICVARAPEELRPRLLKAAPKCSTRELQRKAREGKPRPVRKTPDAKPTRAVKELSEVTVVIATKRHVLTFEAVGDGAYSATLSLENAAELRLLVHVAADGSLTGEVEFERVDAEAAE